MGEVLGLSPTPEQERIIDATARRVRVNARAGTGKTTTLAMVASTHQQHNIIYLTFSARTKQHAEQRIAGATVDTVHGFANKSLGEHKLRSRGGGDRRNVYPADFLDSFRDLGRDAQWTAWAANQFLTYFLNSREPKLEDAVDGYALTCLPEHRRAHFGRVTGHVIRAIQDLMGPWVRGEAECPHDFYLKYAVEKKLVSRKLSSYDVLLIDEAQDMSPVMLGVIEEFSGKAYVVGDSYQQIYQFRHAVDAMALLEAEQTLSLTQSHRFGKEIAQLVEDFVHVVGRDRGFQLNGHPTKGAAVQRGEWLAPGTSAAIISRTNYELLERAAALPSSYAPVFAQDPKVIETAWDVYNLSCGERSRIHDKLVSSFGSLAELERYANEVDDRKLRGMARMVKTHGKNMRQVLARLKAIPTWAPRDGGAPSGQVLATIHSVKGLEFPVVQLCGDMFEKLGQAIHANHDDAKEEVNMVYVAMTRAESVLVLPEQAWTMSVPWPKQSYASNSVPSARSQKRYEGLASAQPCRALGQRVRTPGGDGNIVPGSEGRQTLLIQLDREKEPVRYASRLVKPL